MKDTKYTKLKHIHIIFFNNYFVNDPQEYNFRDAITL